MLNFNTAAVSQLHTHAETSQEKKKVWQTVCSKSNVDFPDVDAWFPGGNHLLKAWIKTNLKYPEISWELGDQGVVYVNFIVELDGSISNAEVVQGGVTDELNREAIRIIESMPQWTSAQVKGKSIRTRCRVPVYFILGM